MEQEEVPTKSIFCFSLVNFDSNASRMNRMQQHWLSDWAYSLYITYCNANDYITLLDTSPTIPKRMHPCPLKLTS